MDPLSNVLSTLKPQGYLFHTLDVGADWSIQFPAHMGIKLDAVVSGSCWLVLEGGDDPVQLLQGDCFLLTSGRPFVLTSDPELPPVDYLDALTFDSTGAARCKSGGDSFLVGAHFSFEADRVDALFRCLPKVLHISATSSQAGVLRAALNFFAEEINMQEPGGALVMEHLAHIMLIQVLRLYLKSNAAIRTGWLYALEDRHLGAALTAMHSDMSRRWTLSELAKIAGMSRSSFAARFKEKVGISPMEYLTTWRMQVAGERVQTDNANIAQIGHEMGYQSDAAFNTAFKKVHGHTPGQHRKAGSSARMNR